MLQPIAQRAAVAAIFEADAGGDHRGAQRVRLLERLVGLRGFCHTEARIVEPFGVHLPRLDVALDDQHEWYAGASMLSHLIVGENGRPGRPPAFSTFNLSRIGANAWGSDDHKISSAKTYALIW